jgi:hypothetical protein
MNYQLRASTLARREEVNVVRNGRSKKAADSLPEKPRPKQSRKLNKVASLEMEDLPTCIFQVVQEFLPHQDYRNLVNSSENCFQLIKFETVYYDLNHKYSLDYAKKSSFRNMILSKVKNKRKQISVLFRGCTQLPNRLNIVGVNKCKISSSPYGSQNKRVLDMSIFNGIEDLSLYGLDRATSFEGIENVSKLVIDTLDNLVNVSALSNLTELKITNCPQISDVSSLGCVYTLKIENAPNLVSLDGLGRKNYRLSILDCPNISDVSMLGKVHLLNIIRCPEVADVNALGRVYCLNLSECPKIEDVSGLGYHDTLILGPCEATDYSSLIHVNCLILVSCKINSLRYLSNRSTQKMKRTAKKVKDQNLLLTFSSTSSREQQMTEPLREGEEDETEIYQSYHTTEMDAKASFMALYCDSLYDISFLKYMQNVTLGGNNHIQDVSMLCNVEIINLMSLSTLSSLQGLGKRNNKVSISECDLITDFSPLKNVSSVEIISCNGFTESKDVENVSTLLIKSCSNLEDISHLSKVYSLTLVKCEQITNLKNLTNVHDIEIRQCNGLKDITGLGKNYKIVLDSCNRLSDILPLRSIKIVKISRCFLIDDVDDIKDFIPFLEFQPPEIFPFGFFNFLFF